MKRVPRFTVLFLYTVAVCTTLHGNSLAKVKDALKLASNGESARSMRLLKKLVKSTDRRVKTAAELGLLHFVKDPGKRVAQLVQLYNAHSDLPEGEQALYQAGILLFQLNQRTEAEKKFRRLVSTGRHFGNAATVQLGLVLAEQKKYRAAVKVLKRCKRTADSSELWVRAGLIRADILLQQDKGESASRLLQDVLQKEPASRFLSAVLQLLGDIAYQEKDFRLAWDYFRKLVTRYPRSFEASLARSKLLLLNRRLGKKTGGRIWEVQVAVFRSADNAAVQLQLLEKKGWRNGYIYPYNIKKRKCFSVRIGPFQSRKAAARSLKKVKQKGLDGFIRTRTVK